MAALSMPARLHWIFVITGNTDAHGCFELSSRLVFAHAFPDPATWPDVTERDVRSWLAEYEAAGMLQVWHQGGRWYAHWRNWSTYNRTRKDFKRSTPEQPADTGARFLQTAAWLEDAEPVTDWRQTGDEPVTDPGRSGAKTAPPTPTPTPTPTTTTTGQIHGSSSSSGLIPESAEGIATEAEQLHAHASAALAKAGVKYRDFGNADRAVILEWYPTAVSGMADPEKRREVRQFVLDLIPWWLKQRKGKGYPRIYELLGTRQDKSSAWDYYRALYVDAGCPRPKERTLAH